MCTYTFAIFVVNMFKEKWKWKVCNMNMASSYVSWSYIYKTMIAEVLGVFKGKECCHAICILFFSLKIEGELPFTLRIMCRRSIFWTVDTMSNNSILILSRRQLFIHHTQKHEAFWRPPMLCYFNSQLTCLPLSSSAERNIFFQYNVTVYIQIDSEHYSDGQ